MKTSKYHEKGQGLVEYALIFALVVLAVVVILYLMGPAIGGAYSEIITDLSSVG